MASMLNSLLDYFRLDSRKVTILSKPFKLNLIADTLETAFAMQAKSKHLTLTVRNHASEIVNGDKNRILSIGGNLLSNAIKFTDSGIITLTTRYKDGMFMLTVEDTGTGISEEQKERILKPFERFGNAATQEDFGLGIGTSAEGWIKRGSTFWGRTVKMIPSISELRLHILFLYTAGLPATSVRGATSLVTTLPAATTAPLPIVTPGNTTECPPIHTSSPMHTGCP